MTKKEFRDIEDRLERREKIALNLADQLKTKENSQYENRDTSN